MSKVLKRVLLGCVCCLAVGSLLVIVGRAAGGTMNYAIGKDFEVYIDNDSQSYTNETMELEEFNNLTVDVETCDVEIRQGESYQLSYRLRERNIPDIEVKDGRLTVIKKPEKKHGFGGSFIWYSNMFDVSKRAIITITVPEEHNLSELNVDCEFGNIEIDNIVAKSCEIKSESGSVTVIGLEAETGEIVSEYGNITLADCSGKSCTVKGESGNGSFENLTFDEMNVEMEYGNIKINNDKIDMLTLKAESGNVVANNLTAKQFEGTAEYGNMNIDRSVIDQVKLNCESGNVKANLIGSIEDYDLDLYSDVGNIKVNGEKQRNKATITGKEKQINIQNEYGDIDVRVER